MGLSEIRFWTAIAPGLDELFARLGKSWLSSGSPPRFAMKEVFRRRVSDGANGRAVRSRYLILALLSAVAVDVVRADDVSIAMQVDYLPDSQPYAAERRPAAVSVVPDDRRVMGAWKKSESIIDLYPPKYDDARVPINFNVKNAGAQRLEIRDAYLQVQKSLTDLQPLLSASYGLYERACSAPLYSARFHVSNYGWSDPIRARLDVAFSKNFDAKLANSATLGTRVITIPLSGAYGSDWEFSIEGAMKQLGAKMDRVKMWSQRLREQTKRKESGTYLSGMCSGNDSDCLRQLRADAVLGSIGSAARVKDGQLSTTVAGEIVFTWRDAEGAMKAYRAPFTEKVELGARSATCKPPLVFWPWEGPTPPVEVPPRILVNLELDRRDYFIPLGFKGGVNPNSAWVMRLTIRTPKSAQSGFRLVIDSNQGLITSEEIDLTSFVARTAQKWTR